MSMLRGSKNGRSLLGKSIRPRDIDDVCERQLECKPLVLLCREHEPNFRMGVLVELFLGLGVKGVVRLDRFVLRLDADFFI